MFNDLHIAAFGISPYRKATIPLGDYNADHYLTLLYHAFQNLNWHIGYFDHDGIIAYTNISWSSYSEEISVRVHQHEIVIKSECVGYQGLFTDYGKNEANLERLFTEIEYVEFHLQNHLEQSAQELMNTIPEKQFLNLEDPPMAGKEKLRGFFSVFVPQQKYFITPILVLANIAVFIVSIVALGFMMAMMLNSHKHLAGQGTVLERMFLSIGFNSRSQVLNGQVWRLLTSIFLHFSTMHLVGNMIVLIYIGSMIESKLGKWNFLLLYIFSGIIASMVSVIWHDRLVGGGASGAIFGLFGILLALLSTDFYERSARRALLISTVIFVCYSIIPGSRRVDFAAHAGGLISGYLLGLIAYWGLKNPNLAFKKWGIAVTGLVITVAFIIGSLILTPKYDLEEYRALNESSIRLENAINHDIYWGDTSRAVHLKMINHEGKRHADELYILSFRYNTLKLPSKKQQMAEIKAQIMRLQYKYFTLLFKEFKENDNYTYRREAENQYNDINDLKQQVNKLEIEDYN